jgi:hypothetical protein
MKIMKSYILTIILTIPVTLLSTDSIEQEINEGHLYNEERISAQKLFDVLGKDAGEATNCFGTGEKLKEEIDTVE